MMEEWGDAVALVRYRPEAISFAQILDLFQRLQGLSATGNSPAESFS